MIDEMSNKELARKGHSEHLLRGELDRVSALIERHALTGEDLGYWFDRAKVLRDLLHSGTRERI